MKRFLVFLLLIFVINVINAQKKVLLIGNSLTQFKRNVMPDILQSFLNENKKNMIVETFVMNGQSLYGFTHIKFREKRNGLFRKDRGDIIFENDTTLPTVYNKILEGNYDVVVLQERGNSILSHDYRKYKYYTSVEKLDSVIKITNAKTYIYESFPSFVNDSIKICPSSIFYEKDKPKIQCSETYKSIEQQYDTISKSNNYIQKYINNEILFVPIGYISLNFNKQFPEVKLVDKTGHPTEIFQYLIAVSFYITLTNERPYFFPQNNIDDELLFKITDMAWNFYRKFKEGE